MKTLIFISSILILGISTLFAQDVEDKAIKSKKENEYLENMMNKDKYNYEIKKFKFLEKKSYKVFITDVISGDIVHVGIIQIL